ncbi:hypothetical protein J6590_017725 [Homalodisca vitripennis]|nr:hypothetical protein J6590_017725 [Homalodisca vitripennis]
MQDPGHWTQDIVKPVRTVIGADSARRRIHAEFFPGAATRTNPSGNHLTQKDRDGMKEITPVPSGRNEWELPTDDFRLMTTCRICDWPGLTTCYYQGRS